MNVIFSHDHKFLKFKDIYYSTGGLSSDMLKRYTKSFSHVTILSRQKNLDEKRENLTLASVENVTFVKIPDFKNIRSFYKIEQAKSIIKYNVMKSDAVIARMPSSIGELSIKYAKKYNKPYLIEVVACPWDSFWNHSIVGKIIAPFEYLKLKRITQRSKYVIYVTSEFLQRRYPTNGKETNCSNVSLIKQSEFALSNRLSKIRNLNLNGKVVIGTVGAVDVKYKGQQYVIEALGKMRKNGLSNFEYQLVGGGNQAFLKRKAEEFGVADKVKFVGSIKHEDVFNWMESLDIYIQPSKQEGLPRALIEAMSCGLPCYGSETAGIPELLDSSCLFSRKGNMSNGILRKLTNLTVLDLENQAKKNFSESKKFEASIIEHRRNSFFKDFIKDNIKYN
ncbi:hypothetical protein ECBG_00493 [Enterococcus casseliflavus EC20]|uniref:Uncharacterized protein n=1 Tax=Enterococcus casseliflavus EC20 TaxID=565655 RepID=C9A6W3_ENTCA|nr:glycosyltransferase [Enterococcus casseliflavus]EEV38224.1 hypothetical protein ECBG_00493 [Enterococcus casseliflavus EC20]